MTLKTVTGSAVGTPDSLGQQELSHGDKAQRGRRYTTLGIALGKIPLNTPISKDGYCVVRGDDVLILSRNMFALWLTLQLPHSEAEIQELIASGLNGVMDTGPLVDEWSALQKSGLVVQLPEDERDILNWHEIFPMSRGYGAGEDPEKPGLFLIGDQDGEFVARVNLAGYFFWAFSDGRRSAPEIVDGVCETLNVSEERGLQLLNAPLQLKVLLESGALRLNWLRT